MRPNDSELVERARGGDEAAFEELYRRYRDFVLAISSRFGACGPDALDVLQETFLYFLRKLPAFELRAEMKTFLYPVAKHLALKKKSLGSRYSPFDPADPEIAGKQAPETPESGRARLADMVSALPDAQREVVMLRFADGLPLDEIARALGIPLGTVKSRLHNALSALRGQRA